MPWILMTLLTLLALAGILLATVAGIVVLAAAVVIVARRRGANTVPAAEPPE